MTGLIFGIIVVAWIAYLLPWYLSHRDQTVSVDDDSVDNFAESMQVIRRGSDPFSQDNDPNLEISTPLTRAAIKYEVARAARTAVRRRRIGLIAHLIFVGVGVGLFFGLHLPWWTLLIAPGMLVGFVMLSRASVLIVERHLDARLTRIQSGWDEDTVIFKVPADLAEATELSIEISAPVKGIGSLWEPIPVTPTTYVSKPLVPRSVRTIDLSAPVDSVTPVLPVTAEGPVDANGQRRTPFSNSMDEEFPRAVGE